MRLQDIHDLADKGLSLYTVTRDPLVLSAVKILYQAASPRLTEPQMNCKAFLLKQISAYEVLYTEPLM